MRISPKASYSSSLAFESDIVILTKGDYRITLEYTMLDGDGVPGVAYVEFALEDGYIK